MSVVIKVFGWLTILGSGAVGLSLFTRGRLLGHWLPPDFGGAFGTVVPQSDLAFGIAGGLVLFFGLFYGALLVGFGSLIEASQQTARNTRNLLAHLKARNP